MLGLEEKKGALLMTNRLCIPKALQLVLDDIGWFYGADQRSAGLPSRTGINRLHVLEDYQIVEELGKEIGQKINCMLVIGEWDQKGVLKKVPLSNKWGENWNGSLYYRPQEAEKILSFLDTAEHIEFGFHGLLHDSWTPDGKFLCDGEFYLPKDLQKGNPKFLASDDYLRSHFDAFYEIYENVGFKGEIRSFASPCGNKEAPENGRLTSILKEYGIKFWHNLHSKRMSENDFPPSFVQNGVIFNKKAIALCPWEVYDLDPDMIPEYDPEKSGIIGGHWVNLLRYNPQRNFDYLDAWKRFFDRQCRVFGHILSKDVEFAHHQLLYANYAKVSENEKAIIIDCTEVDAIFPDGIRPDLYVSIRNSAGKPLCKNGNMTLFEEKIDPMTFKEGFCNYKICRTASSLIEISFK